MNMIAFTPADPGSAADIGATEHADYLFNRLLLNAIVRGSSTVTRTARSTPASPDCTGGRPTSSASTTTSAAG